MARIRTVKPEFWEDETIASLSRDARLLFIATLNMADDEGLLRWSPEYVKASAFMYDDDLGTPEVACLMGELAAAELILPYRAGRPQRQLGWVVNFRRHQNINRPQASKLPPPSIQSGEVLSAYKRRDRMTCHLCGGEIVEAHDKPRLWPSLDHLEPRSKGGTDHPSNIRLSHVTCNKARGDRDPGESVSQHAPVSDDSVSDSVNHSLLEGSREQGTGKGAGSRDARARAEPPCTVLANGLLEEHARQVSPPLPRDVKRRTGEQIDLLLDDPDIGPDEIREALTRLRRRPDLGPKVLPSLVNQVRQEHAHPELARASPAGRRQQETDGLFDRAMNRAKARSAREETGDDPDRNGDASPVRPRLLPAAGD